MRYIAVMLAFSLSATALACRFPAHAVWIVGCLGLVITVGMGAWIGLECCNPSSDPEKKHQVKRLGVFALMALVGLILFDTCRNGFDIIVSVSVPLLAALASMSVGFFAGCWFGKR